MPKNNDVLKERRKRIAAAYKKIKEITGLKFDEKDVKQVQQALGKIYIDGHNYCISHRMRPLSSVESQSVIEAAKALEEAQKPTNQSFVSIMNPDDPYAIPRMVPYRNPNASVFSNDSNKWLLKDAAKAYEKKFKETHRANIRKLREDIGGNVATFNGNLSNRELYFDKELFKEDGNFKEAGNYIKELTARSQDAVNMCNAILLGRGYTIEELCHNTPEVLEAKKAVGQELLELMYGTISVQEKNEKFQNLLDEAIEGFTRQRMRTVDYSDDSTFDNARYNKMLAAMVTNAEQVIDSARRGDFIDNPRLSEQEERLVRMKNFTDGIILLDSKRISEIENESRMPEVMINQLLMDRMGTNYNLYRTAQLGQAENELNIGLTIQNAIDEESGDMEAPSEAYQNAYDSFVKTGDPEPFKALLNQYVDKNETVIQQAEKNIRLAANDKKVLQTPEDRDYWYEGIPGMTADDYLEGLGKALSSGASSQTGRKSTMRNLFLAYGLYEAEQNGQNLSIQDFFTNTELQKETGRKAYEFFTSHPIPGATAEETEANVKAFGQVIAALNRKILDTEIPRCNFSDPLEAAGRKQYLHNLQSLLVDSHQLKDLVPRDMQNLFIAEQGGEEKYREVWNQTTIGEYVVKAQQSAYDALSISKKAFKEVNGRTRALMESCMALHMLNTEAKDYQGKKIGECPKEETPAQKLAILGTHAMAQLIPYMDLVAETAEGKKQLLEYAASLGEKDPAGISKLLDLIPKMYQGNPEQQAKAAEEIDEMLNPVKEAEKKVQEHTEPKMEEAKVGQPAPEESQAEEPVPEEPQAKEHASEDPQAEEHMRSQPEETSHDWSAEYTPEQWQKRLEKLYNDIDSHDPVWLRSSAEYKALKAGLKEAAKAVNEKERFNELMDKVFKNAGDYIQKKQNTRIGEHYGKERLEVVTNVRDLLAAGNEKPLSSEKIGELFGTGDTPEQKMESAIINIGKYLWNVQADVKNQNYKQAYKARTLLERVLTEGGKNRETLEQLRAGMKFKPDDKDRKRMMEIARDGITHAAIKRVGMNARMASWYPVMDAYKQVVKNDPDPKIQELAEKNAVRNVDMIGSLAQTAMSAKIRAVDVNTDHNMTKNELGAIVALNTFEHLIKKQDTENREDYISMMHAFLKEQKSAENIAQFFTEGEVGKRLEAQNQKGDPEKYIFGAKATQAMADEGEHKFIADRLQKEAEKFGSEIPNPQQVKQNKAQMGPMNF